MFGGEEHGDDGAGLAGVLVNQVHLHVEPITIPLASKTKERCGAS